MIELYNQHNFAPPNIAQPLFSPSFNKKSLISHCIK
nr:MAG TPA: hypothetical protein [Caudoviricetes sp.]